jgi:cation/acetate symporter
MAVGLGLAIYYMVRNDAWLRGIFHVSAPAELWWGIQPISAAAFGVPAGMLAIIVVSLLTPAPSEEMRAFVERIRFPKAD